MDKVSQGSRRDSFLSLYSCTTAVIDHHGDGFCECKGLRVTVVYQITSGDVRNKDRATLNCLEIAGFSQKPVL
jgi:hypothetical protein